MSVFVLIRDRDDVGLAIPWAAEFAQARKTSLVVLCWFYSPFPVQGDDPAVSENPEIQETLQVVETRLRQIREKEDAIEWSISILQHPNSTESVIDLVQEKNPDLLVMAAQDSTGRTGASYASNSLLRDSPSNTVVLFSNAEAPEAGGRVMVVSQENQHDRTAISLGGKLALRFKKKLVIASIEEDSEEEAIEVRRRELLQAARDAGVDRKLVRPVVFPIEEELEDFRKLAENQNLVLIGANSTQLVRRILELTDHPTVGVVKRAPPIKTVGWQEIPDWVPRLSPADYADLIHSLRTGSRLSVDFLSMLALAAVIATLGLLQDSPAVVIGSMLLAPLMTPMIGTGLALAQANAKLGRSSAQAIVIGFFMTLAISFLVAELTPGEEMTSQVLARGDPNILDLGIAIFSAVAASYALARPNIAGAVAGVAIATALVPPLCSVGISVAYNKYQNAAGATVLFVTNVVAIILGAAITFRMLGVIARGAAKKQRRWVYRTVTGLILIIVLLAIPLERRLKENILKGKPRPSSYPLTYAVMDKLVSFIDETPGVELVAAGRPSSDTSRVTVILSSPELLPRSYAIRVANLIRRELNDEKMSITVHCLREGWLDHLYKQEMIAGIRPLVRDVPQVRFLAIGRATSDMKGSDVVFVLDSPERFPPETLQDLSEWVERKLNDRNLSFRFLTLDRGWFDDTKLEEIEEAVRGYVHDLLDVEITALGKMTTPVPGLDIAIVLSSNAIIPVSTLMRVSEIVQARIDDPNLTVKTFCLLDPWQPDHEEETRNRSAR